MQPYANIAVTLPNSNTISSQTKGKLPILSKLSPRAREAIVLPQLKSLSLISLGQLCDDNCKIHLDKKELKVHKEKELVMKGYRNLSDRLWDIPIITKLQQDNYKIPLIHPSIYMTTPKKSTILTMPITKQKKKSSYKYIYTSYPM